MRSIQGRPFALSGNSRWNEEGNFLEVLCGNIILDEGNDADGFCFFDNAPGHREIEDMDIGGIIPLKRLLKYSPFLTLVEAAISCWKAAMKRKMQEEMYLFINADALKEPGQTLQEYSFRHVKSIVERTSCEITPQNCVGWYNHTMTYIPD